MSKKYVVVIVFLTIGICFAQNNSFIVYVPTLTDHDRVILSNSIMIDLLEIQGFVSKKIGRTHVEVYSVIAKKSCYRVIAWFHNYVIAPESRFYFNVVLWSKDRIITLCTTNPTNVTQNYSFFSECYQLDNDNEFPNIDVVPNFTMNKYLVNDTFNLSEYIDYDGFLKQDYYSDKELISALIFKGYLVGYNLKLRKIIVSDE